MPPPSRPFPLERHLAVSRYCRYCREGQSLGDQCCPVSTTLLARIRHGQGGTAASALGALIDDDDDATNHRRRRRSPACADIVHLLTTHRPLRASANLYVGHTRTPVKRTGPTARAVISQTDLADRKSHETPVRTARLAGWPVVCCCGHTTESVT